MGNLIFSIVINKYFMTKTNLENRSLLFGKQPAGITRTFSADIRHPVNNPKNFWTAVRPENGQ